MTKIHGKHTRVYMDGYDISGDFNSFEPSLTGDVVDVSGFGASTKSYAVGLQDTSIRVAGLFNDAANRVHAVVQSKVGTQVMLNATWGTDAGRAGCGGTVNVSEYNVASGIGGPVSTNIALSGGGGEGVFEYVRTLWGYAPFQAAPTGFDTGETPTNAGFSAHLQLIGGAGTVIIQSSTAAAGPTWTDRINFGSHSAPWAGYRGTYTGTAPQYLRAAFTGVAGTGWVGYKRF